jgi:hypothetical protein
MIRMLRGAECLWEEDDEGQVPMPAAQVHNDSLSRIVERAHDCAFNEDDDPFMPNPVFTREDLIPNTVFTMEDLTPNPVCFRENEQPVTPMPVESNPFLQSQVQVQPELSSSKKRPREEEEEEAIETSSKEQRFQEQQTEQWNQKFKQLVKFRTQTGHCLVASDHEDCSLSRWVKRQRYQHKLFVRGKFSTMASERVEALESIGFVWDCQGAAWQERLNELHEFRREHHHCNVSSSHEDNLQLGRWVKCQRRQYKLLAQDRPSSLTTFRKLELDKLGFEWELRCFTKERGV